jgi:hypothetical protein
LSCAGAGTGTDAVLTHLYKLASAELNFAANKGLDKNTIHLFMGEEDPNPNTPNPKDPSEAIRNAIRNTYARWPGAIIPYTLSTRYTSAA